MKLHEGFVHIMIYSAYVSVLVLKAVLMNTKNECITVYEFIKFVEKRLTKVNI